MTGCGLARCKPSLRTGAAALLCGLLSGPPMLLPHPPRQKLPELARVSKASAKAGLLLAALCCLCLRALCDAVGSTQVDYSRPFTVLFPLMFCMACVGTAIAASLWAYAHARMNTPRVGGDGWPSGR